MILTHLTLTQADSRKFANKTLRGGYLLGEPFKGKNWTNRAKRGVSLPPIRT